MKTYYTMTLSHLKEEHEDEVVSLLFDSGCAGSAESIPFYQSNESTDPVTLPRDEFSLDAYFHEAPSPSLIERLRQSYPYLKIDVRSDLEKDWNEEWKSHYKPFCLVDDIWVVPAWMSAPEGVQKQILIQPGMAFGTGTHETTRLAAEMLSQVLKKNKIQSLVDVGAGTGLLCFVAAQYGVPLITGLEIDPEARRSCRVNVELNFKNWPAPVELTVPDYLLHESKATFDCVVANIIDGVLSEIQNDLKTAVASGGHLILTGILDERDSHFRKRFSFEGFSVVEKRALGEWVGYHLCKINT